MDKRRAARGYTHEPYDCCGKTGGSYGRPKGKICDECAALIADGRAARDKAAAEREAGRMQPYRYHERDYAAPHYHGYGIPSWGPTGEDLQDGLRTAMYELVHAVSQPAPETTPPYATQTGKDDWKNPWPHVTIEGQRDRYEWGVLVLMQPSVQAALNQLDQTLRKVLPATYLAGKEAGRSVLQGLANGEVSVSDFDDALLTADERAKRERARRGY